MLPVEDRVAQLKLGHMFNIVNGSAPSYLQNNVQMVQHRYGTRRSELACVVPRVMGPGKSSFKYTGICLWNSLPVSVKRCNCKHNFKKQVRLFLWNKLESRERNMFVF